MSDAIVVGLIALAGTLISVYASSRSTQNKVTNELKTQNEIQNAKIDQLGTDIQTVRRELNEKIDHVQEVNELKFDNINKDLSVMKEDIASHNHYAQMFSETVPVVQEKQSVANKRISDLEQDIKKLFDRLG